MATFSWNSPNHRGRRGHTVWALFTKDSDYFPADRQVMLNYRVRNLESVLAQLRKEGVRVDDKTDVSEYGKFGWAYDPEGNKIELWEPPQGRSASPHELPME